MKSESFQNFKAMFKRELSSYFFSPLAYVFIVIFLLLSSFFTFMLSRFFEKGQANLSDTFFLWHPWLFLFLIPAVGMRLWSEEQRLGTIELLLTMPITTWQAISAKFSASFFVIGIALLSTFPIVITVAYLGNPDLGAIFGAYLGSLLLGGSYLAITIMTSAISRNQVISFVISLIICLFFILSGYPPILDLFAKITESTYISETLSMFSLMSHFETFQRGILDLRDLLFFLSFILFFLFSTKVILESKKSN